jgi:hypothetical protein
MGVMKHLVPLVIGCVLVGVAAIVVAIVGWNWSWFALANGALALLLLALFRGSVTGADPDRPPGAARASAARWAGPFDPDTLAVREQALEPDHDAAAEARAEDLDTGFAFLWTAAAPAAAAVVAVVFYL